MIPSFRDFIHPPEDPRMVSIRDKDYKQHAHDRMQLPLAKELFTPWEGLYAQPFLGITTDGKVVPDLYKLQPNGAPSEAMLAAVHGFLATLSAEQRAAVGFSLDAREWRRWNNTEINMHPYGLRLELLSNAQRDAMLAVLRASLSAPGYEKVRDVMRLNQFLGQLVNAVGILNEWSYNFSLFGKPARGEPWGWQLFGHHLSLNCLVRDEQMVLTPTFLGAEPDHADEMPYPHHRLFEDEENGGLELMRSLPQALRERAVTNRSQWPGEGSDMPPERWHPADERHLGGAFRDNRIIPYEGVRAIDFSPGQRKSLLDLMAAYLAPMPEGPHKARMEEVEAHLADTHFAWIGGYEEDSTFYYRIQSPVVLIEFDHHRGVFLANDEPKKFHVHTLVRTPNGGDYGMDLLRLHYEQAHHGQRPGGG